MYVHPGRFPPELHAGSELAMDWLCRTLVANGHEVVVVAMSEILADGFTDIGERGGYRVVRSRDLIGAVHGAVRRFRPEVVVASHGGAWTGHLIPVIGEVPMFLYEHEVATALTGAPPGLMSRAAFIANSEVTAEHLLRTYGIASTVVRPLFGVDQYAGLEPKGDKVLFVSLQPRKGADVAIRIAQARPNARFVFVESWTRMPERTRLLRGVVGQLPNVTLLANRPGLGDILPEIKLLLMPSRGQESWGRTATEAQMCGIPVLGSSRGNLKTTIGPGGVTLDPDEPIECWLEAFDSIMNDPKRHRALSRKALAHGTSFRPQIEQNYQVFERLISEAAARRRA
jgi:glycosyltransferase involved in cell wall biosynthesis